MATLHLHETPGERANRVALINPTLKGVASVIALFFALIAFVLPGPIVRLVFGIIALAIAAIACMPPLSNLVRVRLWTWFCTAIAVAAFFVALFRALGADHT